MDNSLPPQLQTLIDEVGQMQATMNPGSVAGMVYAWCKSWLHVRAQLVGTIATEQQLHDTIRHLEQAAVNLVLRLQTEMKHETEDA
ncbi:MAG: hypothetical protein HC893_00460 [Chloroflexaceae bacterium]|nr:hypothetical protein [Chloroflexaceae bacterium]